MTWDAMVRAHHELHESAIEIQKNLKVSHEAAREVFEKKTLPILAETLKHLQELKLRDFLDKDFE